jgi:hypothetical protein
MIASSPATFSIVGRRSFLQGAFALGTTAFFSASMGRVSLAYSKASLLSAPIELRGDWAPSPPEAVMRVLVRAREVCLSGVPLLSDRQPERIRVDNRTEGPPAIWLHKEPRTMSWILVDIGPLDWCKLAYQFGHELGHVFCNSWDSDAKPQPPTQWLEEAIVEAFSIRGLGRLATDWEHNPPFTNNASFARAIREYRSDLIKKYRNGADERYVNDVAAWFRAYRDSLPNGVDVIEGPGILGILAFIESDIDCVADLGAMNRWPARSGVPIERYLTLWDRSCREIGAPGRLPTALRMLLGLA